MQQLNAALFLKDLIEKTNTQNSLNQSNDLNQVNFIFNIDPNGQLVFAQMSEFSNEFVHSFLSRNNEIEAFVITDVASMDVKGKQITYFLYKGYHKQLEKGLVFYQIFNPESMEFISDLQFSNSEENIFYQPFNPDGEESSCNAMETANHTKKNPEIAFLIGHINEERLIYDIERLIIDTTFNVLKNPKANYNFILQISRYGEDPTNELKTKVKEIENTTKTLFEPVFKNVRFNFVWE